MIAVVDEKLQVGCVMGLRVADFSVMLALHGRHTQIPAYGISEKWADLFRRLGGWLGVFIVVFEGPMFEIDIFLSLDLIQQGNQLGRMMRSNIQCNS